MGRVERKNLVESSAVPLLRAFACSVHVPRAGRDCHVHDRPFFCPFWPERRNTAGRQGTSGWMDGSLLGPFFSFSILIPRSSRSPPSLLRSPSFLLFRSWSQPIKKTCSLKRKSTLPTVSGKHTDGPRPDQQDTFPKPATFQAPPGKTSPRQPETGGKPSIRTIQNIDTLVHCAFPSWNSSDADRRAPGSWSVYFKRHASAAI